MKEPVFTYSHFNWRPNTNMVKRNQMSLIRNMSQTKNGHFRMGGLSWFFKPGAHPQSAVGVRLVQVSFCSKVGFFFNLKTGHSNHPQTSRLAFLADFSGILQLKNTVLGPHRHPGNAYLIVWKVGVTRTYASKMKSRLEALLGDFERIIQ